MGVIVQFNLPSWRNTFPEFASVSDSQVLAYEGMAEILHRNDGGGPVSNTNSQTQLLNLVVAHLCFLFGGVNGQPANQTVGRISDASEGSVSVSLDYGTVTNSQAFWVQSKYGATYWAMTSVYRTMRVTVSPRAGFGGVAGLGMGWPYG